VGRRRNFLLIFASNKRGNDEVGESEFRESP